MTQQEFERRIGKSVSTSAYAMYEKIYMAAGNMDKDEFCKAVKGIKSETLSLVNVLENELETAKHQTSVALAELEKETEIKTLRCRELEETIKQRNTAEAQVNTLTAQKIDLAKTLIENGLTDKAIEIIGHAEVIAIKASANMPFSEADRLFIIQICSK